MRTFTSIFVLLVDSKKKKNSKWIPNVCICGYWLRFFCCSLSLLCSLGIQHSLSLGWCAVYRHYLTLYSKIMPLWVVICAQFFFEISIFNIETDFVPRFFIFYLIFEHGFRFLPLSLFVCRTCDLHAHIFHAINFVWNSLLIKKKKKVVSFDFIQLFFQHRRAKRKKRKIFPIRHT